MTDLYDLIETESSYQALEILSKKLPEPLILLGGWAVYLSVNNSFKDEFGSSYLGSRDVDIGFHLDPCWEIDTLEKSNLKKAVDILVGIGYKRHGSFRFSKIIHNESGKTLSEESAKDFQIYELFYLYVDLVVDNIHPDMRKICNIDFIDEPILGKAWEQYLFVEIDFFSNKVLLPIPQILLAMKLNSLPNRTKDDKKIKDACDIYSLIWYSSIRYTEMVGFIKKEYPDLIKNANDIFKDNIPDRASIHLGIDKSTFINVIQLIK